MRRRTISRNIFLVTLVLILLAEGCSFLLLCSLRRQTVERRMEEQSGYIDVCSEYLDGVFQRARNIVSQVSGSASLARLCHPKARQQDNYTSSVGELAGMLESFVVTNEEIDELFVWSGFGDYLYTSRGLTYPQTFFENRFIGEYETWYERVSGSFLQMEIQSVPGTNTNAPVLYLISTLRINNHKAGNVVIVLNPSFMERLFQNKAYAQQRIIYILNEDGSVLSGNRSEPPGHYLSPGDWYGLDNENVYQKGKGLISQKDSNFRRLKYLVFTPEVEILGRFDRFFLLLSLLLLLVSVVLIAAAYGISRRMSRPFRNIVSLLEGRKHAADTGGSYGSESTFIERQVVGILSANSRLQDTVDHQLGMILKAVLFEHIMGCPSVEKLQEHPGLPLDAGLYCAYVVRVDLLVQHDELFFTRYYKVFCRTVAECGSPWVLQILNTRVDEYVLVTCCSEPGQCLEMERALARLEERLEQRIPHSQFRIEHGEAAGDLTKLRRSYEQALEAVLRRGVQDGKAAASGKAAAQLPLNLETMLLEQYETRDTERVKRYLTGILDNCYRSNITIGEYTNICSSINNYLLRLAGACQPPRVDRMLRIRIDAPFYGAQSLGDILFSNLAVVCEPNEEPDGSSISHRVLAYIQEHFRENINLMSVADRLGYNAAYLSRYFKQNMGINFTDYLNREKVGCAKQLLMTTTWTINRIGQESGFTNSNLFIRTFLKYEGVTPGDYRLLAKTAHPCKER